MQKASCVKQIARGSLLWACRSDENMNPHVFLVAGEESGDRLGAALISAIKDRTQGKAHFSGVGARTWRLKAFRACFPLGILRLSDFLRSRRCFQKSCGEYKR